MHFRFMIFSMNDGFVRMVPHCKSWKICTTLCLLKNSARSFQNNLEFLILAIFGFQILES